VPLPIEVMSSEGILVRVSLVVSLAVQVFKQVRA